jgi:hypothetical protein
MTGPRRWAWFNSRSATPAVADVEDLRRNNTGIVKHDVCIKRKLETEVSSVVNRGSPYGNNWRQSELGTTPPLWPTAVCLRRPDRSGK